MSATRIVCTIGPATNNPQRIVELADAGMNIARLNGSHADLEWHADTIRILRETVPDIPILLDIPGRKIRTAQLRVEPSFERGDTLILTTDERHDGSEKIPVNYDTLHTDLSTDDIIVADDGTLRFTVSRVDGRDIHCRAETAGQLKSRKGINVPHVALKTGLVTDRDRQMVGFARELGVDFIGISFVESAEHVEAIRGLTEADWPRIVSKVENRRGLDNVEEIVAATDAVMIDRGDLSVETTLEDMALSQKRILDVGRRHGKPVIVATEMLHTMIDNPFPTKAEVSDITNAVLDGAAATMLSGETAVGANPIEAVQLMRQVASSAEGYVQAQLESGSAVFTSTVESVPQAMGDAAALVCRGLPVTKIVAVTVSGYAARMIAARRPRQPILAVSNDPMAARSFNLIAGTEGVFVETAFSRTSTDHIVVCLEALWRRGKLSNDDVILVTAVGYPRSGNRMNLLQIHQVGDLANTLNWRPQ